MWGGPEALHRSDLADGNRTFVENTGRTQPRHVSLGEPHGSPWLRTARVGTGPTDCGSVRETWGPVPALSTWSR